MNSLDYYQLDEPKINSSEIPELLDNRKTTPTDLFYAACCEGHITLAIYLIEKGVDVNQIKDDGDTALILAADSDQLPIIQLLIEHGADLDAQAESDGDTALIAAAYKGNFNIAQYLVAYGASLNLQNIDRKMLNTIKKHKAHQLTEEMSLAITNWGAASFFARVNLDSEFYSLLDNQHQRIAKQRSLCDVPVKNRLPFDAWNVVFSYLGFPNADDDVGLQILAHFLLYEVIGMIKKSTTIISTDDEVDSEDEEQSYCFIM